MGLRLLEFLILDFPYTLIADLTAWFGSLADLLPDNTRMSGIGGKADVFRADFENFRLHVRFFLKQTFATSII